MVARPIQRQIVLPVSKAFDIAWKSLRMRMGRSLLVTSGIVLALAFLSLIRNNQAMVDGMRLWIHNAASIEGQGSEFDAYRSQQIELRETLANDANVLAKSDRRTARPARWDPAPVLGSDWGSLQKELGALPVAIDSWNPATADPPAALAKLQHWIAARRKLLQIQQALAGPQSLQAMMHTHGIPTDPVEIANDNNQARWLSGLALLVAFVGILNSMLMSVTERYREIGTMKCLGALDSFIIKLFVIESLLQGMVGTVLGVGIGCGLSLTSMTLTYHGYAWKHVLWDRIIMNLVGCVVVGIVLTVAGAVYPAWRGARMQPIEAMRADT